MARYFIHLAYNGFTFRGWQKQAGHTTVQETLENAFSHILKKTITIVGCGRTDAQVHATQFFAHFDIDFEWNFDLVFRLNQFLPNDIVIFDIIKTEDNAHVRFDAIERTYEFYVHTVKDPFLQNYSYYFANQNLKTKDIVSATALLTGYEDFQAFCKTPDHNQTTYCKITKSFCQPSPNNHQLKFQFTANRFLRGMIRALVQKILEVGTNEISIVEFEELLKNPKVPDIKAMAAPYGLYLTKVNYPFINLPNKTFPPPSQLTHFSKDIK